MKRFGWIAALLGVALLVSGCNSEKPKEPVDRSADIDIKIDMPGNTLPADVEKPANEKKADTDPKADEPAAPAMVEPEPAETKTPPTADEPAAKPGTSKVHKAVGKALMKAVTGSSE